jgi:outer membrane protein assembly factor BamB
MGPIIMATWLGAAGVRAEPVTVSTYHYDAARTGWNKHETSLSAAAFPANFGVIATVALDDQVDAQPLLVPAQSIAGGVHDVLYVVTENNTVYGLDAQTGAVLVSRNLGPPVPTPLGCGNNGPEVGITSTPVIDLDRHRIVVMAYVNGMPPEYQLHALDLVTLADRVAPVTVTASHTLSDGTTFAFDATYQRQRPALLLQNGAIYAGFGSFCDFEANHSRGWVLGWQAGNLKPLASSQLDDTQAASPTDFFLSSVWMSGFGLASNGRALFFATGNSDCNFYVSPEFCPPQSTYDGVTNVQESVIGLTPSLAQRTGVFTPSNVFQMDIDDADLGAAGVLLLPVLPGGDELAAIVSKDGRLFLLDQNDLGTAVDMQQLGAGCWCGPSYYRGADGTGRVVTAAGALQTWEVSTSPSAHWVAESTTATIPSSVQDPGFFTVVSSDERKAGTAIIWAVGRPTSTTGLMLYAFSATPVDGSLPLLYAAPAGQWPNLGGNANIVPVVANGLVYVGAYRTVTIFGPNGSAAAGGAAPAAMPAVLSPDQKQLTGTLIATSGAELTLRTRSGEKVGVDASAALERQRVTTLIVGQPYTVLATVRAADGALIASSVMRAKPGTEAWPADR